MAIHCMVDLETFGAGNDALIISIGAVKFDATTIFERFHIGIDPASAQAAGLKMDASTLLWWLDPERAPAWAEWQKLEKVGLAEALDGFDQWYRAPVGEIPFPDDAEQPKYEPSPVWGNGATFDNVILRSAYRAFGYDCPWPFWVDRCYRTVKNLAPEIKLNRLGTHHSAVDDAESQARHLQVLAQTLGVVL